jgi:hypothetical protein
MKNPNKEALLDAAAALVEPALNEEQAAAVVGVLPSVMRKMRRQGTGPAFFMVGVQVRYRPESLRGWMKAGEVASMAEAYRANPKRAREAEAQREALAKVRVLRHPKTAP